MKMFKIAAALALLAASSAGHAAVTLSVEAAGAQNSSVANVSGVATFDNLSGSYQDLAIPLGTLTATFSKLQASGANVYGGANGTNFVTILADTTISLSKSVDYFGLWGSALDGGNAVELLANGNSLGVFNLTNFALDGSYAGNPNGGGNSGEKYAFFNFKSDAAFDQIKLIQNGGGGFELDNVTIGNAVPEPATWAMMILGMGAVGYSMRRRRVARPSLA